MTSNSSNRLDVDVDKAMRALSRLYEFSRELKTIRIRESSQNVTSDDRKPESAASPVPELDENPQ